MDEEEFEKRLFELCLKYDKENGNYPESEYEGAAIYRDYVEQFPDWNDKLTKYNKELETINKKG